MMITRNALTELRELHEDVAENFTDTYFPISGETYWTCVQALAEAKLAELRGELNEFVED
tara:strand:- start:530 stop:709 length:180 start_codon:yes stop_codon:yes gene_type:complete